MSAKSRLDYTAIEMLASLNISGSPDLVAAVVTMFLESLPAYLATLRHNTHSPDLKLLHRVSHDLKSSSASVGAADLALLCAELEALVRSGTTRGSVLLVCRIVEEIEAVCPELEALLRSRRGDALAGSTHAAARTHEEAL